MTFRPDPKPRKRARDPELLRELHHEWNRHGCALCRRVPGGGPSLNVELHHIQNRSQGGPDTRDNIVGLCAAFVNDCHGRVTRGDITISANGWLFEVVRGRPIYRPGANRLTAGRLVYPEGYKTPRPVVGAYAGSLPEDGSPAGGAPVETSTPTHAHPMDPGERQFALRNAIQTASELRLKAALILYAAVLRGDHSTLGLTLKEYAEEVGISEGESSRMRRVVKTFGPDVARPGMTLSKAVLAARLVDDLGFSEQDAMHEVLAQPKGGVLALLKKDEPTVRCTCTNCGKNHVRGAA